MTDNATAIEPASQIQVQSVNGSRLILIGCVAIAFVLLFVLRATQYSGVYVIRRGESLEYRLSAGSMAITSVPILLMGAMAVVAIRLPHPFPRTIGWLVLLVVLLLAVSVPNFAVAKLVLTPEGCQHTAGAWWRPKVQSFQFSSLESLRVIPSRERKTPRSFTLEIRRKSGEVEKIPKSSVLEAGLKTLLERAMKKGVAVEWAALPRPG